ncbi:MAG: ketopantoate hydroxymethyltransferase [Candidatus Peregrinibacteria bacterium GW2011_GWF2_43_17]|nr:MAG: ketopantoate hydroxymethyltransferase [Candidatus Peregrinibacteria bacterium GW2011_GWF2_43_17]KKT20002.1 MAG: hypothetical protein UW03_C0011G0023 [Candidatus Peregrinibacteria bacterium GW2011_GWA2_43_8]HAU39631.1 hypothetical protein [Candidatus Peregrinibacteria bacterium]
MFNFNLSKGILGINARNLLYIKPFNKKKAIRLADSKLKTKHFLSARGIPVPKLYGVIREHDQLEKFDFNTLPLNFVLKPNLGFGGEGIIPIVDRENGCFITSSGEKISITDFKNHIRDIIDGRYSITGSSDIAFFEQLLVCDDKVAKFSYKGLPDVRVVVHNLVPVMAMLRLPTVESRGRANLHQGAIAVGIDIAKGIATNVVKGHKLIEGPKGLKGFEIPYWDEILLISSKVQLMTNIGYLAVDIALDRTNGPVLLEVNARAGLSVQIANLAPLRKRLERIHGVKVMTPEKGVRIAQDMFGNKVEKDIKNVSGKVVVGEKEMVSVITKNGVRKVLASINPVVEGTIMDLNFARDLKIIPEGDVSEEKRIKIKFNLADIRIQTVAGLEDLSKRDYKLVVGKRDLSDFLIDPSKKYKSELKIPTVKKIISADAQAAAGINYSVVDNDLADIDRQIKMLYHLRPVNLIAEKVVFLKDKKYNPQFVYPDLRVDPFRLREKLKSIKCDSSILGRIFSAKRDELLKKLSLIEHVGTDAFSFKSIELFGAPDENLILAAKDFLKDMPKDFSEGELTIDHNKAVLMFNEVLEKHGFSDWKVRIKKEMVSDCMVGKDGNIFFREGAMFSEKRMKMLIAHEIETHVLTAENGKKQPYKILQNGMAGYLKTQEGLAIRNQMQLGEKTYWPALSVLAIDTALHGSFSDVVALIESYGCDLERAFKIAVKVKRGIEDTSLPGAFTKDSLYFKGYLEIKAFEEAGGDINDLYFGKFDLKDLDLVKKMRLGDRRP